MATVDKNVLRDTFVIWFYASITSYDDVVNGTKTPGQLLSELEQADCIKSGDEDNRQSMEEIVTAIQANSGEFQVVRQGLTQLTAVGGWGGSGPHPGRSELKSVFISPRKD